MNQVMAPVPPTVAPVALPIVMIGNAASGKSTVGRTAADELGVPFVDSDAAIVARHGEISLIFEHEGEASFRRYEAEVIREIITARSGPYVLSVGGGATVDLGTRKLLRGLYVIWLDVDLPTVLPRLARRRDRPIMNGDIAAIWTARDEQRRPVFEKLANFRIDARGTTSPATAWKVTRKVRGIADSGSTGSTIDHG